MSEAATTTHGPTPRDRHKGAWSEPCADFLVPPAGVSYPAYCNRCGFSRTAHEKWDDWTAAAQEAARIGLSEEEAMSETAPDPTTATTRYLPSHPRSCSDPTGRHMHGDDFQRWWATLTEAQRQWLRDKASWEHMTLSAVAMDWGVPNA